MRVSKVSLLLRSVSGASAEEPVLNYWGGLLRVAILMQHAIRHGLTRTFQKIDNSFSPGMQRHSWMEWD